MTPPIGWAGHFMAEFIQAGQPVCPLCRTGDPTQAMHGTHLRICTECTADRPVELIGSDGGPT